MTVALMSKGPGLTDAEIRRIEEAINARLPDGYRQFLIAGNIVVPAPNLIQGRGMSGSVSMFLGVDPRGGADLLANVKAYTGRLPKQAVPIALAGGGNLVCMMLPEGSIHLWDHEQEAVEGEEPGLDNMHFLADSFEAFLDAIQPFDESAVRTDPGALISVKTSPGFREKFKDYLR